MNSQPDVRQGELTTLTIPDGIEGGYVAIVWEGTVEIAGEKRSADDCKNRIANVKSGDVVALADGVERARLAILGVDDDVVPIGQLARGSHPFLDVADASNKVTFILRVLDFSSVTNPLELETWSRPGFLLSTIDGPRLGNGTQISEAEISELDFVVLIPDLSYAISPGTGDQTLAMILDFYVEGDPAEPRDGGGIDGCKIRCWEGGLED